MAARLSTQLTAEFIGTFALIFIGAGTAALGLRGFVGVAFAHGLVVATFASSYGPISGLHVNPAVTISVLVAKHISPRDASLYIVVQLLGESPVHCSCASCWVAPRPGWARPYWRRTCALARSACR